MRSFGVRAMWRDDSGKWGRGPESWVLRRCWKAVEACAPGSMSLRDCSLPKRDSDSIPRPKPIVPRVSTGLSVARPLQCRANEPPDRPPLHTLRSRHNEHLRICVEEEQHAHRRRIGAKLIQRSPRRVRIRYPICTRFRPINSV